MVLIFAKGQKKLKSLLCYNIYNRCADKIIGNDFVLHVLDKRLVYSVLM